MPEPHPWPPASDSSEKQNGIVRLRVNFDRFLFSCMSVGFIFLSVHALRNWQEEAQLSKHGILISGVITDRKKTADGSTIDGFIYTVSYRFSAPSVPTVNTEFRRKESVDRLVYKALEDVRFVDVRFLPEDPRVSRLEVAGFRSLRSAFGVVFWIVLGAFYLYALASTFIDTGKAPPSKKKRYQAFRGR
jgi:hypothetical protein